MTLTAGPDPLFVRGGPGSGDVPLLLLLHGMAGTGAVWLPFVDALRRHWPGEWRAVDLHGHGRSLRRSRYSFGGLAADVSDLADVHGREVVVLGHSMGGAVGLLLATGLFGVDVRKCATLGLKLAWTDEEKSRASALAARAPKSFDSRQDAEAFWLKLTGLQGAAGDTRILDGAVFEDGHGWHVSFDNAANGLGGCDGRALVAASQAPVLMVRGERDELVSDADIRFIGIPPLTLPGAGHNAHVEAPDLLVRTLMQNGIL